MKIVMEKSELIGGFTEENDLFNRKEFAEKIHNLVLNNNDGMVIALDANWGEGKSTFVKMWQSEYSGAEQSEIDCIYFDAFENDYQKDAFIAVTAEIYAHFKKNGEEKREIIKKTKDVAKVLLRGAMNIGIKFATGGVLSGSLLDGVEKEVSDSLIKGVDKVIEEKIKNHDTDKMQILSFRNYLSDAIEDTAKGHLVFVIDELDRCRPDFALDMIEYIKHIFSVKNITFILVLNRNQLEASIKARYGENINANLYLQKFIDLWLTLPKKSNKSVNDIQKYCEYVLKRLAEQEERIKNPLMKDVVVALVKWQGSSFREIEKILTYFAVLENMIDQPWKEMYQVICGVSCVIKVTNPDLFVQISTNQASLKDVIAEIKTENALDDDDYLGYQIETYVTYDMTEDAEQKEKLSEQLGINERLLFGSTNVLHKTAQWLVELGSK